MAGSVTASGLERPPTSARGSSSERLWRPKRVILTRSAREFPHGRAIAERAAKLGIAVDELPNDRVLSKIDQTSPRAYAEAKSTLAVVVAPPSKLKLQPIAPSADWRLDLAEGCPAHCSYCYLAGSLKGPPITRVYANLDEILETAATYMGRGNVTSRQEARVEEGTTFEASCYTDPLAIEPLTGSLAAAIQWFGRRQERTQLRFTTKFANVGSLLGCHHNGNTRMRASLNPAAFARHEGGTRPVRERLAALRRMAEAGYPVGLTIAPILATDGWEVEYGALIQQVKDTFDGIEPDLTVELITHRFTPGSRDMLRDWYPGSDLEMNPELRAQKRTKFGSLKFVYDQPKMRDLRRFFEQEIAAQLPTARILYWT